MKLYKIDRDDAKSKIQKRILGTEIGVRIFNYYISVFIYNKDSKKRSIVVGMEFQRQGYLTTMITRLKDGRINVLAYVNIYKVI